MSSPPFGSLHVEEVLEFGQVDGFFLERRLHVLYLFNGRSGVLDFFDPFFDVVVVLVDFGLNIVQILNYLFTFLGHLLYPLYDAGLFFEVKLFQVDDHLGRLLIDLG